MGKVWDKGKETSILWLGAWGSVILIDKGGNSSKYPTSLQHSNICMNKYSCKWRLICNYLSLEANDVIYGGLSVVLCVYVCVCLCVSVCVCVCVLTQRYLTLCDPVDCSLPGSSVPGISQARILEWVAISFSRGSSLPRDQTCISCIGRRVLYHWATREARNIFRVV